MPASSSSPSSEYTARLGARREQLAQLERRHIAIGVLRLALLAAITVTGWLTLHAHLFSWLWILLPAACFAGVLGFHGRVLRARAQTGRAITVYEDGLARIEDRWAGRTVRATPASAAGSLYAADLDLFGPASLFELLCTARTRMGEHALAAWLLAPAALGEIEARHAAVAELAAMADFREAMSTEGERLQSAGDTANIYTWAERDEWMAPRIIRYLAPLLAVLAIAGAVAWTLTGSPTPFLAVVLVEGGITYSLRARVQRSFAGADTTLGDLQLVSSLLARIEASEFRAPRLVALQNELVSQAGTTKHSASGAIAKLRKLVQYIDSRDNLLIKGLDVPLLYSVQLAYLADDWRRSHGRQVRRWFIALGEMEALLSIAAYHYEHPGDPFPTFLAAESGPSLRAQALGHPLIPAARCVRNDLELSGGTRVLLVSGSNMSGKSTLMRSAGINIVLAMAGAPVRAASFALTPMQVAASILVNDSLQQGASRFYAEISRLRAVADAAEAGPLPVFFLLDELLQGTNSHDRLIGAQGITRALVAAGAIGIISTHDLALTEIAGPEALQIRNLHFADRVEDGKMLFDFILRDGRVTRSNGIELMRLVGLKV